ncbi:MAG: hypothetical protein AB8B53_09780 [Flavobacteriales bacterium]
MRLDKTFHIGAILAMVVFGISLFIMKRVNLRARQLSINNMDVDVGHKHWIFATICTLIFIVFYALVAREFKGLEDYHNEDDEETD